MSGKNQEFENFSELTKRLLSVPKVEVDKRHEEWKRKKDKKKKSKKTSGRGASRDFGGGA